MLPVQCDSTHSQTPRIRDTRDIWGQIFTFCLETGNQYPLPILSLLPLPPHQAGLSGGRGLPLRGGDTRAQARNSLAVGSPECSLGGISPLAQKRNVARGREARDAFSRPEHVGGPESLWSGGPLESSSLCHKRGLRPPETNSEGVTAGHRAGDDGVPLPTLPAHRLELLAQPRRARPASHPQDPPRGRAGAADPRLELGGCVGEAGLSGTSASPQPARGRQRLLRNPVSRCPPAPGPSCECQNQGQT